jgi:hypothetical protein
MLMIVMSLAISLLPMNSLHSHREISSQTTQNYRVQQENKDSRNPIMLPKRPAVTPIGVPAGDNAWAVQIVSSGGFSGSGRGDLTLASDGILYWNGADGGCSRKLAEETMNALTRIVLAADLSVSSKDLLAGAFCADCYVTSMIVQHRGAAETISMARMTWDDPNQSRVPADFLTIYETLMAQRGCKAQ